MLAKWNAFRENLFGVFYIMTEHNIKYSKRNLIGTIRCVVLYLIDAGQVLRVLIIPEFGWDMSLVSSMQKMNIIEFAVQTVDCFPISHHYGTFLTQCISCADINQRCSSKHLLCHCRSIGVISYYGYSSSHENLSGILVMLCPSWWLLIPYHKNSRRRETHHICGLSLCFGCL